MTPPVPNLGAVAALRYVIAWTPKYRRPVLDAPVARRLSELLKETSAKSGMTIRSLKTSPDSVRLTIDAPPTLAAASIVGRLKAATHRVLRREFAELRTRLPTLWNRNYYAATVSPVRDARQIDRAIADFLESQRDK
jgi:putative transposase